MTTPISWPHRSVPVAIEGGAVHIWAAWLDVSVTRGAELAATLSADERERARRFFSASLTSRFVAARGHLRELLGCLLGVPASDLRFAYDAQRKPRIVGQSGPAALHFNVSHSGPLALYAIARGTPLGVDVEEVRGFEDLTAVARQNFSMVERQRLDVEPAEAVEAAFFRCWTRKEAYLKATGMGLMQRLDSFDVSLAEGERPALLRVEGDTGAARRWTIAHLQPATGYIGALAIESPAVEIHCWCWR